MLRTLQPVALHVLAKGQSFVKNLGLHNMYRDSEATGTQTFVCATNENQRCHRLERLKSMPGPRRMDMFFSDLWELSC